MFRQTELWGARLVTVLLLCAVCLCIAVLPMPGWAQNAGPSAAGCPSAADISYINLVHNLQDKSKGVQIRRAAAASLALVGQAPVCTDEVVSVLIRPLAESSTSEGAVRAAAARAVGVIFQSMKGAPSGATTQVAVRALVKTLAKPDPDPMVRASAAWALGQLPEHSPTQATVAALINTVRETHVTVGEAASLSLIGMSQTAVPELRLALMDPDANFRWKVAWILGQMGAPAKDAVPTLSEVLNNNQEDPNVRAAAAWAIGSIGRAAKHGTRNFPNMVNTLTEVLSNGDNDANIRSNAAWALGRMGPEVRTGNAQFPAVVTTALEHGLADSDSDIRRNAAWALGQINPNPQIAGPALTAVLLSDTDRRVRLESAAALGQIGAVGTGANQAVGVLSSALNDQFLPVRAAAAVSLGQLGADAQEALKPLASAIRKSAKASDEEQYVARAATEAVVKIAYALDVEQRTDAIDRLREAANEIERAGDHEHATKVMNVVYKLNSMRWFSQITGALCWIQQYRAPILAICVYVLIWFFLYWQHPFLVFQLNEAMKPYVAYKLPKFLGGIPLSYLVLGGFFHYRPRVLDAWIARNLECTRNNFTKKPTVQQRAVHVDLPAFVGERAVSNLRATDLRPYFEKRRTCILICGEGGAGKTSLACEICNWAMSDGVKQLADHPMLGVLLEQEDLESFRGDAILTEAVRSQLWFLLDSEAAPSLELVEHLLRYGRILVVVDGFSEMSEAIQKQIQPGHPQFAARALVITSRVEEAPPSVHPTIIRPMRVSRDHLSTFMEAYLVQRGKRDSFSDAEYFDDLSKLSRMAGEQITVLLAKLYAEQMIAAKETFSDARLPENIPELMLQYLNELNRKVKVDRVEDRIVHEVLKVIAWECLEQTLRPVPARLARVIDKLGTRQNLITYLQDSLRVVQIVGVGRDYIRFTLDPLAEYVAALHKMEELAHDQDGWHELLARADHACGESAAIRGFLLALHDCCVTQGVDIGVPRFVVKELANRVAEKPRIHDPEPEPALERTPVYGGMTDVLRGDRGTLFHATSESPAR
jgi:HEAT repeat protein